MDTRLTLFLEAQPLSVGESFKLIISVNKIFGNKSIVYLERKYQVAQKFIDLCKENPKTWEIQKKDNAAQV